MVVADTDRFFDRILQFLPGIVHFFYVVFIIRIQISLSVYRRRRVKLLIAVLAVAPALITELCTVRIHKVFQLFRHLAILAVIVFVLRRLVAANLEVIPVTVLKRQRHVVDKVYPVRPVIHHHIAASRVCRKRVQPSGFLRVLLHRYQSRFRLSGPRILRDLIQLVVQHVHVAFSHLDIGTEGGFRLGISRHLSPVYIPLNQHIQSPGSLIGRLVVCLIASGGFYGIGFRRLHRVLPVYHLIGDIGVVDIHQLFIRFCRQFLLQSWDFIGVQGCLLPASAPYLIHHGRVARRSFWPLIDRSQHHVGIRHGKAGFPSCGLISQISGCTDRRLPVGEGFSGSVHCIRRDLHPVSLMGFFISS